MLNKKQSIKQEQYGQCVFFFSDETGAVGCRFAKCNLFSAYSSVFIDLLVENHSLQPDSLNYVVKK